MEGNKYTLYTDGSCGNHTEGSGWATVTDAHGIDITDMDIEDFRWKHVNVPKGVRWVIITKFTDVTSQQVNGSELMALYFALKYAVENNTDITTICSDSQLMVEWWSKGHVNAKTAKSMDSKKLSYIKKCGELRKKFEARGGKIVKIAGKDNPADVGYHR